MNVFFFCRSERPLRSVENNGVSDTRAYSTDNTLSSINFSGASIGNLTYGWDANKNKTSEAYVKLWLPSPSILGEGLRVARRIGVNLLELCGTLQ